MKSKQDRIKQLLGMAYNTTSSARSLAIANQILEIDSEVPEALMIKADNIENDKTRADLIKRALDSLEKNGSTNPEDKDLLFVVLNQRLAFTLFTLGQLDEAFISCEKVLESDLSTIEDDEDEDINRNATKALYYRIMLARKEWQKILAETMKDSEHSPAWAYSRLIAAFMLAPEDNRKTLCAKMFWDALILAPEIPFYMLGYSPEPDDDSNPQDFANFNFAVMYYDAISVSEDFYNWFSRGVILFGLLTNRFDSKEREYMLDVLDTLGGYEEYEQMNNIIMEREDSAVIEALAAHKCLSK